MYYWDESHLCLSTHTPCCCCQDISCLLLYKTEQERPKSLPLRLSLSVSVLPALADLQLTTLGSDSVKVQWKGSADGLRGYWVTWEGEPTLSGQRSTLYLPPHLLSTTLTHVSPNARVCVSPVYKSARGEGLCCNANFKSGEWPALRQQITEIIPQTSLKTLD